jgi:hypothetical protein
VAHATGRARPLLAYCDHGPKNSQSRRVAGVSPSAGGKRPKFGRIDPFCLLAVLPVLLVAGILGALVNVGLGLACAVFAGLILVFDSWVNRPARRPAPEPDPEPTPQRRPPRDRAPQRPPAQRPPVRRPPPPARPRQVPPGAPRR